MKAKTVFNDPFLVTFPDDFHSHEEDRFHQYWQFLEESNILIIHTEDNEDSGTVIRFISARKVTPSERKTYEKTKN